MDKVPTKFLKLSIELIESEFSIIGTGHFNLLPNEIAKVLYLLYIEDIEGLHDYYRELADKKL